jgi:hypothetical protein
MTGTKFVDMFITCNRKKFYMIFKMECLQETGNGFLAAFTILYVKKALT